MESERSVKTLGNQIIAVAEKIADLLHWYGRAKHAHRSCVTESMRAAFARGYHPGGFEAALVRRRSS